MTPVIYRGQFCYAERRKGGWKVYTGPGESHWNLVHESELDFMERSAELPGAPAKLDAGVDALKKSIGTAAAVVLAAIGVAGCAVLAVLIGGRW